MANLFWHYAHLKLVARQGKGQQQRALAYNMYTTGDSKGDSEYFLFAANTAMLPTL